MSSIFVCIGCAVKNARIQQQATISFFFKKFKKKIVEKYNNGLKE